MNQGERVCGSVRVVFCMWSLGWPQCALDSWPVLPVPTRPRDLSPSQFPNHTPPAIRLATWPLEPVGTAGCERVEGWGGWWGGKQRQRGVAETDPQRQQ